MTHDPADIEAIARKLAEAIPFIRHKDSCPVWRLPKTSIAKCSCHVLPQERANARVALDILGDRVLPRDVKHQVVRLHANGEQCYGDPCQIPTARERHLWGITREVTS